ncbi:hypothetical protein TVAG_239900 [Trichomonas vaginalis G3]|uniref:Transglutaminase-like domain-containing protein n=1 Tax=Trichomonas vaginalis (strain ATCC PRA-98 / G3) TaxID=412133 RepID=A2EFD3_TRIV3|nr:peptide N-glycanase (PNGase)-related family [Trichomonas vaginalis G3]EAY08630.1 hypothetical protein TVAG_239900 [Trichomonas vaginalis G3]KAI5536743.1 peptide N-glycanase (PNGase)-related family [Trichomonas vaginalis G3]|eukprot:XP_001320853.1 hypothetical protein [Trichomonas vaginalis G3]
MFIEFSAYRKTVRLDPSSVKTLSQAFEAIKGPLGLTEPKENYVFLNHVAKEFKDVPITYLKINGTYPPVVIATKAEQQKINEFLKKCFNTLSVDSILMPTNAITLNGKINLMQTMIRNAYNEDDVMALIDIIPSDKFADLSGLPLIQAIVDWFRTEFMQYMQKPLCHCCQKEVEKIKDGTSSSQEREDGAVLTYRYRCGNCNAITRFPRYTKVSTLIETKVGQSLEYSVLITSILNFMGFPSRIVCNMHYDRFWVEAYSYDLARFVHVDPVEGIIESEYIYEQWSRKIVWIIAVSQFGVADVTARYTKNLPAVNELRNKLYEEEKFKKLIRLRDTMAKHGVSQELLENETAFAKANSYCPNRELTEVEKQPQKVGNE